MSITVRPSDVIAASRAAHRAAHRDDDLIALLASAALHDRYIADDPNAMHRFMASQVLPLVDRRRADKLEAAQLRREYFALRTAS
jgi:hypothetical protein